MNRTDKTAKRARKMQLRKMAKRPSVRSQKENVSR